MRGKTELLVLIVLLVPPRLRRLAGSRFGFTVFVTVFDPGLGHALAYPALADKFPGQLFQLETQQICALIYQADHDVGTTAATAAFQIRPICLVTFVFGAGETADRHRLIRILVPQRQIMDPQIIAIVLKQFFQGGAGDSGQLYFGFLAGGRRHGTFDDILFPASCGLHHLVDRAVLGRKKTPDKTGGPIENDQALPNRL